MPDKATREQIVAAADQLFYRQGYQHTSFGDIATEVQISRGNFYYHFKSKDEILEAVILLRLADTRKMLDRWEIEASHPAERIHGFIQILIANRADIERFGCPVGTLSGELAKLDHPARERANELFSLFRIWLRRQFTLLGRKQDADALAMHVLARSQGIATLAAALRDEGFIEREVQALNEWLSRLQTDGTVEGNEGPRRRPSRKGPSRR